MADILFISPHPDDECLSMGMGISNHIWHGHNVYVALLSHGNGSSAIDVINGNIYCGWHDKSHEPELEGYLPLNINEFTDGRVEEFRYSSACLGVKPENVIIYGYEDGRIIEDDVKKIIRSFLILHQNAAIKTTSYLDIHPDHSACGNALLDLYHSGEAKDARFYISPGQWESSPGYYESNPDCEVYLQASLAVYKRWNPQYKMYGVGYHSVSSLFEIVSSSLKSKYHEPDIY